MLVERFERWATPERSNFYLAGLLLTVMGLFVYNESTGGLLDRVERVRGRDFLQLYIAGQIIAEGNVRQLYDQDHFLALQKKLVPISEENPRYYSLYPPMIGLAFSPLARLPYSIAITSWWLIQAACFLAAGTLLLKYSDLPDRWKKTIGLAMAIFYPVCSTFLNGQLSALLLLVLVCGLELHRRDHWLLAGIVFSLLALKPQFAPGVVLWLLLRWDVRTLVGIGIGGAIQLGLVATLVEPAVLGDYLKTVPSYAHLAEKYRFAPDYEHSLGGILMNLLGPTDAAGRQSSAFRWLSVGCKLVHFGFAGLAGVLLFRVIHRVRRKPLTLTLSPEGRGKFSDWRAEQCAVVLFSLLLTPHLLVYDLTLLLIPILHLWSLGNATVVGWALPTNSADRGGRCPPYWTLGFLLYLAAMISPIYSLTRFSIVPVILLWVLFRLASTAEE